MFRTASGQVRIFVPGDRRWMEYAFHYLIDLPGFVDSELSSTRHVPNEHTEWNSLCLQSLEFFFAFSEFQIIILFSTMKHVASS